MSCASIIDRSIYKASDAFKGKFSLKEVGKRTAWLTHFLKLLTWYTELLFEKFCIFADLLLKKRCKKGYLCCCQKHSGREF
jgi:hypothetical protein